MRATTRIRKIMAKVYDSSRCALCHGTGTLTGKRKGTRNSGCAQCFVRSSGTYLANDDLMFLVDLAVKHLESK